VKGPDHPLELLHLPAGLVDRGVLGVGSEEPEGVVAPVVAQAALEQMRVVDELVDGHQLDGRDAQLLQVPDHRRLGEAGVGAAHLVGDLRMQLGQALHVGLVDQALVVGDGQAAVARPVEEGVDHDAEHHVLRGVLVVAGVLVAEVVAEQGRVPLDRAVGRLRVRVEQQLVRVAAQTRARIVRPVHPVPVALARVDLGQVAVPHVRVHLGELDAGLDPILVEQAQLDLLRDLAEQGEVGAPAVVGGSQGIGRSRPDLHSSSSGLRNQTNHDTRTGGGRATDAIVPSRPTSGHRRSEPRSDFPHTGHSPALRQYPDLTSRNASGRFAGTGAHWCVSGTLTTSAHRCRERRMTRCQLYDDSTTSG